MIWVVIGIAYAVVVVLAARPVAGDFAWRLYDAGKRSYPLLNGCQVQPWLSQWIGATMLALLVMLLWPVVLPAAILWRVGAHRPIGREREQVLKAREAALRKAERELGLGR